MIKSVRYGSLEGPLARLDDAKSRAVARGWANTDNQVAQVIVKRVPHFELVREVLCNLLAQAVDLPVPTPYVLDTQGSDWDGASDRFVFATSYDGHSSLLARGRMNPVLRDELGRWPKLPAAIAFDAWIANEDRTASNLLFAGRRGFVLIDHGDALPNRIRETTQVRNGLAKHLVATHGGTSSFELADRVKAAAVNFGHVDFAQLKTAALLGNWEREHLFDPCVDLLTARLNRLPELIEEEFRLGQGQLLA